jgi:hypothetical protein
MYKKMKLKKIGSCKIPRRFGENAYELELPKDVGILPIFNISNLYPCREDGVEISRDRGEIQWKNKMLVAERP